MTSSSKLMNRETSNQLVNTAYKLLQPLGISYVISYLLKYPGRHNIANFCGNLIRIKDEYQIASDSRKAELTGQFENIIDTLVLKNGVRKTTYPGRQNVALSSICTNSSLHINKESIRVLDIPSSVGLSSIDMYDMLAKHYTIANYMMADQYFEVLYDTDQECIFDDSGGLLQVKFKNIIFSIYRPHTSGNAFGIIAKLALLPFDLASYLLRKKYAYKESPAIKKLLLLHPEAESKVNSGQLCFQKSDIFNIIDGQYDLILSFNLLQKNYFSNKQIKVGTTNLYNALNDGGLLVMGNTESYSISKKDGDKLIMLESVGDF